jgi:hypothetical protein
MHSQGDVNGRHLACSPQCQYEIVRDLRQHASHDEATGAKGLLFRSRIKNAQTLCRNAGRTSYKPMPQEILLNQQHASIYDDDLTGCVPTSHKA